ncbi:formylglycine-generating enzyme family protein [Lacticaseibacillus paracasei]|uniref:formylglycine-generating enzyme family protein n=1 Tax=Lacticaseibacillus paracasei TaxID=1597 RepID=UPI0021D0C076|nr:formylglycine-generating enzyme family protein [Lacticaseibacillus paracasei]MCU6431369.1 formylglycine-generating enzyme family protein [Lacticaseibacillus paracasei]
MRFKEIKGGSFQMGTDDHIGFDEDYEGPPTIVRVPSFSMADTPVTNADFDDFIAATAYQTVAERLGSSFVFELLIPEEERVTYQHVAGAPWWLLVPGADWQHPYGAESSNIDLDNHPVVHVALEDALAYCQWSHSQLPTEAQWEYAAGAGTATTYPWGESLVDEHGFHANTWQGDFPNDNTAEDGFVGTVPVKSYEPNSNGLYQMIGNVWEWCRNPRYTLLDDFNAEQFKLGKVPAAGEYAIRGGSFLCHCSYCNRYRTAARNGVDLQSTSSHLSFRCIKEVSS